MSINSESFNDALHIVSEVLNKYDIPDKQNRMTKIKRVYDKIIKDEKSDREFYSLVHEIKSFDFIKTFGRANLANDEKHIEGPDITYKNNKIECVCCSEGEILNAGYEDYSISHIKKEIIVIDYNKTKEFILPRISNSLSVKKEKFDKYISKNIVKVEECAIIFFSLGELNIDFHAGTYGREFLEVLLGKGPLCYVFNTETKEFTNSYWQHIDCFKKNTGNKIVDINANFFNRDNINIAGVLISVAPIYEKYNLNNTFLFLNPYAKNPVNINDFNDIVYWKCNKNDEYLPMKNNKSLWNNIKANTF